MRIVSKVAARFRGHAYSPSAYWEARSSDLIETYDHPETWEERGWIRQGVEEETVPALLRQYDCQRVLVPGAGSGRQYEYLTGFDIVGFDISPTLAAECRLRYPEIPTFVSDVVGPSTILGSFDAVITSAVLAHVPPKHIRAAAQSLRERAGTLVILREYTKLGRSSTYQFAHDYDALFSSWHVVHRETTDDRDGFLAELIAFKRP